MKNYKLIIIICVSIFIVPHILYAFSSGKVCNNYTDIYIFEAIILGILLIIGLWRKPKSKLGLTFVSLGVIQLLLANHTFKNSLICAQGFDVKSIDSYVIGALMMLALFFVYYYIGYGLGRLYGSFSRKKRRKTEKDKNDKISKVNP